MNDIYVWLILLGIIYILPEVFKQDKKRKGRGKYKYPQFPDLPQFPTEKSPQTPQQPQKPTANYPGLGYEYYSPPAKTVQQDVFSFAPSDAAPAAATLPPPVNVPVVTSSASPWQGVLAPQVLANAVVFSEIILPPRAHRPLGRHYGDKTRR